MSDREGVLLLVDDDSFVQRRVARHLRGAGWRLEFFDMAEQALAWLQDNPPPDCIISDNRMPRMDGPAFLERVTALPGVAARPRHLCSEGRPPADVMQRIAAAGAGFVSKDALYDRAALLALLDRAREEESALDAPEQ